MTAASQEISALFAPGLGVAMWRRFYQARWNTSTAPRAPGARIAFERRHEGIEESATSRYYRFLDSVQWVQP